MSLVRGRTSNLGMLLGFHRVLVTLHVVVLAVVLCGGAMRLGGALVVLGRFCVCLVGHLGLPLSGEFPGRSLAASIVFAASAFVVFNELNWLVGRFDSHKTILSGEPDAIGA
jgi:hypothetical protein